MIGDGDWEEEFWYEDQLGKYDYSTGEVTDDEDGEIGSFIQMLWDETTEIGCAKAR